MRTSVQTADRAPLGSAEPAIVREAGFTLVEMLVAMLLLSLVGLTLARFQTFQLSSTASLAAAATARLEADNMAVDLIAAPAAPAAPERGTSLNAGRTLYWTVTPGPSPDPTLLPDLVLLEIEVGLAENGPPLATRSVLRSRGSQPRAAP